MPSSIPLPTLLSSIFSLFHFTFMVYFSLLASYFPLSCLLLKSLYFSIPLALLIFLNICPTASHFPNCHLFCYLPLSLTKSSTLSLLHFFEFCLSLLFSLHFSHLTLIMIFSLLPLYRLSISEFFFHLFLFLSPYIILNFSSLLVFLF